MSNLPTREELEERIWELEKIISEHEKSADELNQIFEKSLDMLCIADIKTATFLKINPAFTEILGYSKYELLKRPFWDFIHPDDINSTRSVIKEKLLAGLKVIDFENRYRCKDGSYRWMNWKSQANNEEGKIYSIARDTTERKLGEAERMKLVAAIEQGSDIVVITDAMGNIEYVNRAFEKSTGYSREEAIGQNPRILKSGQQDEDFYNHMWSTISGGITFHDRIVNKRKDGSFYTEDATISPIFDTAGKITNYVAAKRDITVQLELEEKARHAQKMETVGTLAGGIAHDFNNILSAIIGFSELAKDSIPAGNPALEDIDTVLASSMRAAELVQQILTFSSKSTHRLQPIMPHMIVQEALKMLRSSLPATLAIEQEIDPDCGSIMADPTKIHQIVMNIGTNAFHAMENEKGILTVGLHRTEICPKDIHEIGVSPGPFIVLSVSDTGHGMDEQTVKRVFEPYFTLKEVGKGSGLGLSVVHGIVKDYKGFIRVDSKTGEGTVFKVYLPALAENAAPAENNETGLPTGTERILVIDDEESICRMHKTILDRLGYTLTALTDSREALQKIRQDPDQFDLIVTDQSMPYLSGVELAEEVLKIKPDMPIILCTGYSSVITKEGALAIGIKHFSRKPVERSTLAKIVRRVLDENV